MQNDGIQEVLHKVDKARRNAKTRSVSEFVQG